MKKIIALLLFVAGFASTMSAQDVKASFPGGEEALTTYLLTSMQYPAAAKDNGIEGVVGVTFVVKADGTIGNIKIRRMVDPDLESEAIRLVKGMPKWTPASNAGTPVESQVDINVPFTLE